MTITTNIIITIMIIIIIITWIKIAINRVGWRLSAGRCGEARDCGHQLGQRRAEIQGGVGLPHIK